MNIDVLRPSSDTSPVVDYDVVGGTEAWEVLCDEPANDATYIDPDGGSAVPVAYLGFGSTSTPADHMRHQLRMNLRGWSTFGPAHRVDAVLFFGVHSWSQRFTYNNLTPTELIGTWRSCPPELVTLPSAQVAGEIRAVLQSGGSPLQVEVSEAYIDVDYREKPTATGLTLEGNTITTTFTTSNLVRVRFGTINPDGLPVIRYQIIVTDSLSNEVWSYDLPAITGTAMELPPLPNGSYTASFRVTTRVAGSTPFEGDWYDVAFTVDVAPPPPPSVSADVNPDGTVSLCWSTGNGSPGDSPGDTELSVFTESGTWSRASHGYPGAVDAWIIGGGGCGGGNDNVRRGGGGGAGQVRILQNVPVNADVSVVVGAGATNPTVRGESSWFGIFESIGGGNGSRSEGDTTVIDGGSGGGGGSGSATTPQGIGGTGVSPGGNNGGNGYNHNNDNRASGGGGGAGGAGGNAALATGGVGGVGVDLSAVVGTGYGDSGWFCGGGGGYSIDGGGALGGQGGGGQGGSAPGASGEPGMANTGGGGGGSTGTVSGNAPGGSGIVIIRNTQGVSPTALLEITRTDCSGTRRVAVVPAVDGCYTDCSAQFNVPATCHDDGLECDTTYEIRQWDCVLGYPLVSEPSTVSVGGIENPYPGYDRMTAVIDGECVVVGLCGTGGWQRSRPLSTHTPVEGGLPTVISAHPGGRDYTLNLATTTITDLHALERLLARPLVWYQPAHDHGTWLAPNSESWRPEVGRSHSGTVSFVATGPTPILAPVLDCEPPDEEEV